MGCCFSSCCGQTQIFVDDEGSRESSETTAGNVLLLDFFLTELNLERNLDLLSSSLMLILVTKLSLKLIAILNQDWTE